MNTKIEGAFPLRLINQSSMSERVRKEHPGNMHLWWNRSPIDSSKELLISSLTPVQDTVSGDCNVTIVDPFSGFGGLTLAAAGTGHSVIAGDLNSVATVLTKAVAEIPARFANKPAVSENAENRFYTGVEGLAEDILCYGTAIRHELANRLTSMYPDALEQDLDNKRVYAWIWTRTVTCPNPACSCQMPLANSYVLSKLKNREFYVQPEVQGKAVSFHVLKGVSGSSQQGNKIGSSGARFKCPVCGEITTDEYVKSMGRKNQLGIQLMSVGYEGPNGKEYYSPTEEQLKAAVVTVPLELPLGELPNNTRWFSPPLFGLKNYTDLYTSRQLVLMISLCDLVSEVKERVYIDAVRAGFPDDGLSLTNGGSGALAYSEAIGLYLSLVVGKISNFQSEICTWDNRRGNIRAAFTRQAIPMTWVFAEGNPFSSATGNYETMLQDVVRSVRRLPYKSAVKVIQGDGTRFEFPKNSVLFTELPYYDNVGYADLSDYFYVWMRRCLKDVYPALFEKVVTSKEELTSIPEHFGGDSKAAKKAYEEGIRRLCNNFAKGSSEEYPSLIFFEFGKADEIALSTDYAEEQGLSAWENLLDALIQAGFQVTAVFPVRTEKPNEHYETVRVCIAFRKRKEEAPQTTRRGFVNELKRALPGLLEERFRAEMDDWDRPITGMGCGISFFSQYKKVINADGTNMNIHDALQVIWTEVMEYIQELESQEDGAENKEVSHAGVL